MSTLRVSAVNNAAASVGGLAIDSSGNVTGGLPSPNRNLLYNGAMQVAQRGTSTASITTQGYYTADRWDAEMSSLGTWTQSVENDAPTGSGLRKSLKMLCTTADASPAAGDYIFVDQRLEGQDCQRIAKGTASAQQVTLSFWVKANVTGTYIVSLRDFDNTRSVSALYTISASATWERKTITFPADTTGAFDNDNSVSLNLRFWLAAGSDWTSGTLATTWAAVVAANTAPGQTNLAAATNNYWQITGVQLEVGPVATSFEFKSFGQELRECQRYYFRYSATTASGQRIAGIARMVASAANANGEIFFPVTMRSNPTAIDSSSLKVTDDTSFDSAATTSVSFTSAVASNNAAAVTFNGAAPASGSGYAVFLSGSSAYIGFSAEL